MTEAVCLQCERIIRREVDDLRAEVSNLANRLNHALVNLQSQLDDKVNAEAKFNP